MAEFAAAVRAGAFLVVCTAEAVHSVAAAVAVAVVHEAGISGATPFAGGGTLLPAPAAASGAADFAARAALR